jgi:hypothetical protein
MSMFDDNIKDVPVTAQSLQEILRLRQVHREDEDIERYNKILIRLRNVVEYTITDAVWEYELSLGAVGCYDGNPFTSVYTQNLNNMIESGVSSDKIIEWVMKNSPNYDSQFTKFRDFMCARGFKLKFKMRDFLKSKDRVNDKLVIISWKEE